MMRRSVTLLATLVCAIAAAGCANWTVKSSGATASYGQYRTYAWTTPPGGSSVDRFVDQRVRDAVAIDLAKRGIQPAPEGVEPDFFVDYTMVTGPLVQTVVTPGPTANVGASGATYVPSLPVAMTYNYVEGRLSLDFIDARSGRVFWHGAAAFGMDRPIEVSTPRATQAVGKILRQYPVAVR
jgi:hypothetical protein